MKRDISLMLAAAMSARIPLVIGSCGGAGGEPHLQLVVDIVREIAREHGLHFKMAVIHAEQGRQGRRPAQARRGAAVAQRARIDEATIRRASRIVGMMGPEPYMRALDDGAQVILGGRTTDPAPWAAAAMRAGMPPAPSWYAGKMLECGATPSIPKGHDCLLVGVRSDGIVAEPLNPIRRCTPLSVANHSLHENASPCIHVEPGGMLDTTDCTFEALSDRSVLVSGMRWEPAALHGKARRRRARRLPRDHDLRHARPDADRPLRHVPRAGASGGGGQGRRLRRAPDQYRLVFRIYGKDGVMGAGEPVKDAHAHELGIVVEALADTQEIANAVLAFARVSLLHTDFPGRLCSEGNMAFPFSPSDVELQPLYRFSIFHTVELADPLSIFPIEYETM